jgi:hypothetical protein
MEHMVLYAFTGLGGITATNDYGVVGKPILGLSPLVQFSIYESQRGKALPGRSEFSNYRFH